MAWAHATVVPPSLCQCRGLCNVLSSPSPESCYTQGDPSLGSKYCQMSTAQGCVRKRLGRGKQKRKEIGKASRLRHQPGTTGGLAQRVTRRRCASTPRAVSCPAGETTKPLKAALTPQSQGMPSCTRSRGRDLLLGLPRARPGALTEGLGGCTGREIRQSP